MFRKRAATPWRETAACRRGERRWGARAARHGSYRCGSDGALRNRGGVGAGDCNRGRTQLIQRTGAIRGGRYFIYRPPRTVFDPPSSLVVATGKAPRFTPRLARAPERRSTSTPSYWGALSACRRPPGVPVLSRSETVRLPPAGGRACCRPLLSARSAKLAGQEAATRLEGMDSAVIWRDRAIFCGGLFGDG